MSFALDLLQNSQWAITEDALRGMISAINQRDKVDALEKVQGERPQNVHKATIRSGVGIIPVRGPLFKHANLMTSLCGATSYEFVLRDFHQMLESPDVASIVFDIDSPGGEANGCSELADHIFAARGQKTILAYVGGTGASAAYWIASACDRIYSADSAIVGSIGVQSVIQSGKGEGGIRFVSNQSPNKNRDPETPEGASAVQSVIDSLAEIFVQKVARNRGVDRQAVMDRFGQGAVFVGEEAKEHGLIDEISTLEHVIMSAEAQRKIPDNITAELIGAQYPDVAAEIAKKSAGEAVKVERDRIGGIYSLPTAGVSHDFIKGLVTNGSTVEQAAVAILQESAKTRSSVIESIRESEAKVQGVNSKPTTVSDADELEADLRLAGTIGIKTR